MEKPATDQVQRIWISPGQLLETHLFKTARTKRGILTVIRRMEQCRLHPASDSGKEITADQKIRTQIPQPMLISACRRCKIPAIPAQSRQVVLHCSPLRLRDLPFMETRTGHKVLLPPQFRKQNGCRMPEAGRLMLYRSLLQGRDIPVMETERKILFCLQDPPSGKTAGQDIPAGPLPRNLLHFCPLDPKHPHTKTVSKTADSRQVHSQLNQEPEQSDTEKDP